MDVCKDSNNKDNKKKRFYLYLYNLNAPRNYDNVAVILSCVILLVQTHAW